jgi:hypothetical protein
MQSTVYLAVLLAMGCLRAVLAVTLQSDGEQGRPRLSEVTAASKACLWRIMAVHYGPDITGESFGMTCWRLQLG